MSETVRGRIKVLYLLSRSMLVSGVVIFLLGAVSPGTLRVSDYPEKRITWIVPYSPGGGYDSYSRAIASVLPRYLPKQVNIVIKNVPGAGGRRGAAAIYRAKPDGYTIGMVCPVGLLASDLIRKATDYDVDNFTIFATCGRGVAGIYVRAASEFRTLDDMRRAGRVRFATSGRGSGSWLWGMLSREVLGVPVHLVSGYSGSSEYVTALFRKDVDAFASGYTSPLLPYCDSGEIRLIVLFVKEPWELMPQAPTLQGTPYEELEVLNNDRVIVGPPDLKEEVVLLLRNSLEAALKDPDLLAWSEKTKNPLLVQNAGETEARIREIKDSIAKYKDLLNK